MPLPENPFQPNTGHPLGDRRHEWAGEVAGRLDGDLSTANLGATYAPTSLFDRKRTPRPPLTVVAPLVAGHPWVAAAASSTNNPNDTSDWASGDRAITVTTNGNATTAVRVQVTGQNFNLTSKGLVLWFKLDSNRTQLTQFYLDVGDDTFANRYRLAMTLPSGGKSVLWANEWVPVWVPFAELAKGTVTGTPTRAGLTALRLYWADSGAPITVKFGGVATYVEGVSAFPSGVVSFTMDDTWKEQIKAAEYVSRSGGTVSLFPILGRLGLSGAYYTEADLRKAVFGYGSEFGAHAMDDAGHVDITGRPQATVEAEFRAMRQWAFDHGFPPMMSYAYPVGPFDENGVESVRRYFGYGRTNDTRLMSPTSDHRYSASAIVLGSSTTLAAAKAAVDSAKADKLWANFVVHDLPASAPSSNGWLWSDFTALVDYIVAQAVPMSTAGDVINAL